MEDRIVLLEIRICKPDYYCGPREILIDFANRFWLKSEYASDRRRK